MNSKNKQSAILNVGMLIRHFRLKRGMSQRQLGMACGFDEKTADVRIAQYESGSRFPKDKILNLLAQALQIPPKALTVAHFPNEDAVLYKLFAFEELYGVKVQLHDKQLLLQLDNAPPHVADSLWVRLSAWQRLAELRDDGRISPEEYEAAKHLLPQQIFSASQSVS